MSWVCCSITYIQMLMYIVQKCCIDSEGVMSEWLAVLWPSYISAIAAIKLLLE